MIDALQVKLSLDWPDKNGISNREHYEQAEWYHKLVEPEIPAAVLHVWLWFWQLDSARTSSANGPNPLTYSELRAWREETGNDATPGEIEMIKILDREYLAFVTKKNRESHGSR